MTCTVDKALLTSALARCAAISGTRNTLPILSNVLLAFGPDLLLLMATDLDLGYETVVEVTDCDLTGDATQSTTIHAKKLHQSVQACPESTVTIHLDGEAHIITLTSGTVKFSLSGIDPAEFPGLPPVAGEELTVKGDHLVDLFLGVSYAQATDETKYNCCGVYLHATSGESDTLTAVATDGHRMGINHLELPDSCGLTPLSPLLVKGIIIPTKGVSALVKIKSTGPVVLNVGENSVCIATDNEKLHIRLTDAEFPAYRRMVVVDHDQTLSFKLLSLTQAVERCRVMSDKDSYGVLLTAEDNSVSLVADLRQIGGHAEDRVGGVIAVNPFAVRLNISYLLQALGSMVGNGVTIICQSSGLAPLQLQGSTGTGPIAIIMPIRGV